MYGYVGDSNSSVDYFGLADCNSWNAFQKHHKGQFKNPSDAALAYHKLKTGISPWPIGYTPKSEILKSGTRIRMAMVLGQPANRPGGWATTDNIPDVNMVRTKLAVTEEFKPQISSVQEYEIIKDLPVLSGPVGPQIDSVTGKYLEGGGTQFQMLVHWEDRMSYLKPINSYPIN